MRHIILAFLALWASAAAAATPATRPAGQFTDADYQRHIEAMRDRIPAGFSVVVQPPFVVIGDESPVMVRRRAEGTVKWAVDHLKRQYFARDPRQILDIWLFKDRASYQKHTKLLFDDEPDTPLGYYSSAHKALVMNIETGGAYSESIQAA